MIDNDRIGRAIKTLRVKAGLTQQALADRLYISKMAVSKWERGKSVPDVATLRELAIILDMDVDGLIDGTGSYAMDRWKGLLMLNGFMKAPDRLCDKPLIDYLISYFLLAGVRNIAIECSGAEQAFIEERFGGGACLGARLSFGASALDRFDETAGGGAEKPRVMLLAAPLFLYGVDLTRFMQRAMQRRQPAVNLISVVGAGAAEFPAVDASPRDSGRAGYRYQSLPLFFLHGEQAASIGDAPDPHRALCARADLFREPLDKGFVACALKDSESAARMAGFVAAIQQTCGYIIYCPPEIAWRRGMIGDQALKACGAQFPEYRSYLEAL